MLSSGVMTSKSGGNHVVIDSKTAFILSAFSFVISVASFFSMRLTKMESRKILTNEAEKMLKGKRTPGLKLMFNRLMEEHSVSPEKSRELWAEIEERYSEPHRTYHTLKHLEYFLELISEFKTEISAWDNVLFALYYHDIIYDPAKQNNEEESAVVAEKRLREIGAEDEVIKNVVNLIIATKTHDPFDSDSRLFLDADLSILGENEDYYKLYADLIRQEYKIYPDEIYIPGRIGVLEHFINKETIFHSRAFHARFEKTARENLANECSTLKKALN